MSLFAGEGPATDGRAGVQQEHASSRQGWLADRFLTIRQFKFPRAGVSKSDSMSLFERCDVSNAGGVTTVIKGIALAQAMNVPVELQSFGFQPAQNANLHVMLGLGGCTWLEHPAPHAPYDYATRNPLSVDSHGCVSAVAGPGLGIHMDWGTVETDSFAVFDSGA